MSAKPKAAPKKAGKDSSAKVLAAALEHLEKVAKEHIQKSRNPFTTGVKVVAQIRTVMNKIEDEFGADTMAMTEAGYASDGVVGVGIGVF